MESPQSRPRPRPAAHCIVWEKVPIMKQTKAYQALLQRITDVYSGAQGQKWDNDDFAIAELLSNVVPVLQQIFDPEDKKDYVFGLHALDKFDNPEKAADWIYQELIG